LLPAFTNVTSWFCHASDSIISMYQFSELGPLGKVFSIFYSYCCRFFEKWTWNKISS